MKYLFGPVNSRRLGLSLGIDLLPAKTCNFNCIYCEVGPTTKLTSIRREYIPTEEILAEVDQFFTDKKNQLHIDVVTITAAGEPTLHSDIGKIIHHVKMSTQKPVVVLTNGSLLYLQEVRQALLKADIVIPSLDAALPESFYKVNRPVKKTDINSIISGLNQFRNEYSGQIWLEILLVKDINDSQEDIVALKKAVATIRPDRIQLNTVVRPPCEAYALPLDNKELTAVAGQIGGPVEVIVDFSRSQIPKMHEAIETAEIINILSRRPGTVSDLCEALSINITQVNEILAKLEQQHLITRTIHDNKEYYHTGNCPRRFDNTLKT